jgi:hypothetical protein
LNSLVTGLNQSCLCIVLRPGEIGASFADGAGIGLPSDLETTHPHLFAQTPVYITEADLDHMLAFAQTMERVAVLPNWVQPEEHEQKTMKVYGAFMGYDFHMTSDGPKLIEINTNAGGAFLNLFAAKQFRACCDMLDMSKFIQPLDAEKNIVDMFLAEWATAGRAGKPRLTAIVDETPYDQFLYPEFLLAAKLLNEHGLKTIIASPEELVLDRGLLSYKGEIVDLIYNRLTDFDLTTHTDIRKTWEAGGVVVTPDPAIYRRYADKRNLVKLSDQSFLQGLGVNSHDLGLIDHIVPKSMIVTTENAQALWENRKHYYFKPVSGYGGKAVYKGEKLTRKTWNWIVGQDYIAQEFAVPSQRVVKADGKVGLQKFDVRLYTYRGKLLAAAARLYEGQTTNFRTIGGGFAPLTTL